jgi:hypothetical protein
MKPGLTVYTSVFGDTDPLYDSAIRSAAKFVCLTDNPRLTSKFWQVVNVGKLEKPNRHSRTVKAMSHIYTDTEWSLWIDCNFTLKVDPIKLIGLGDFVNFRHSFRDNLFDEAKEIIRLNKARADTVWRQLKAYEQDGFDTKKPPLQGLSNNGVVLRRHTACVCQMNEAWKRQHDLYTLRDQLCLDYVMWKQRFTPQRFPGNFRDNPYVAYHKSRKPVTDF